MPRIRLNRNIAMRNLDPETEEIVSDVLPNVEQAVNEVVDKFKAQVNARVEAFEAGEYDEDLSKAADAAVAFLETEFAKIQGAYRLVAKAADQAEKLAADSDASAKDLRKSTQKLVDSTKALQTEMDEFKQTVTNFSSKAGGLISSAAVKFITGGVG